MRHVVVAAMSCALVSAPPGPPVAAQGPAAEVRAVIDRVFAGMHEADAAKVGSAFAEGARFAVLSEDAPGGVRYVPIDGWLAAIGESGGRWEERIHDVEIRVDDDVASAWTPYTFYLDGAVRHCGVNSIELLRTPDGWKITQLSDTRRTEGCAEAAREPGPSSPLSWAIPRPSLYELYAIVTHPGIYRPASKPEKAIVQIEAWLESPSLALLAESGPYGSKLVARLRSARPCGPKVHDARIAALCLHGGVRELLSADRDFSRFPDLTTRNPLHD